MLIQKTMMEVPREIANIFLNHIYDNDLLSNHFLVLTKLINKQMKCQKEGIRSALTKTII